MESETLTAAQRCDCSLTLGSCCVGDLIFTTKIQRTALDLGYEILVIGDVSKARWEIESKRPRLVLIDLTARELSTFSLLSEYGALAGPETWLVAFGPHVESETLAGAKLRVAAGLSLTQQACKRFTLTCFGSTSATFRRMIDTIVN